MPAAADEPKNVPALVRALSSDDVAARRSCATALGTRWPEGAHGVPALLALLDDEDASVRAAAAKSIETLGTRGVAPLAAALGNLAPAPAERAFLDEMLAECERLGKAVCLLDTAQCAASAGTPGTMRVALVLAAAFDTSDDGVPGADPLVVLVGDAASGPLAASVIALQGATLARRRGAIPPGGAGEAGEAPAEIRSALRSPDRSRRVLAAKLLIHLGRCGPETEKDVADALAAEFLRGPAAGERALLDALAFARGAVHAPNAELALRSDVMADAEVLARIGDGLCWFASGDEAVALLRVPFAASAAAARIAALPVTPAAAEPALRRLVRQDAVPDAGAAVALVGAAPEDAPFLRELDDRAARLRKARKTEDALRVEFAAYCLAGEPADRLATLRTRAAEQGMMGAFALRRGSFLHAARKGAWLTSVLRADCDLDWAQFADALQSGPAALVPHFVAAAGASRLVPKDVRRPFVRAVDETLLAAACARAVRALEQAGPVASAALATLDALRADPDPRIAVPAARAARAIRRK